MNRPCWENLQPLRIPGGWTVLYNKLSLADPEKLPEGDSAWLDFTEDILQMCIHLSRRRDHLREEQTLTLDLGWYPDGDPTGCFRLAAILDRDWDTPLLEFSSRDRTKIVERLERWLFCVFMPPRFIDKEQFQRNSHIYQSE